MLKVENLIYEYRHGNKKFGVKDINFQIEDGYIYGLVGQNGMGKTTLIKRILRGDYHAGEVYLNDVKMSENMINVKDNMGFIIYPELLFRGNTAFENGEMLGRFYSNWNQDRYISKLHEFDVDMDIEISKLSKGNIMKVMAAFAWGHRPQILIADEPTAGFDPVFRKEFIRFLQEYVEDGKHSVIIATHLTEDLDKIADYVMVMKDGKIILNSSKEELFDKYRKDNPDCNPSVKAIMIELSK